MSNSSFAVVGAMVLASLAGCVGGQANPGAAGQGSSAAAYSSSDLGGLGAVQGRVVSDEQVPLGNVDVALIEASLGARTDEAGRFAIGEVPPGSYRLAAQRLGYESVARRVDVAADAVVEVTLILAPVQLDESTFFVYPFQGFVAFSVAVSQVTCRCNFNEAFGKDKSYIRTNLTPGLEAVVAEYVWQATGPTTSEKFTIDMRLDGVKSYPWVTGTSPLVVRQDELGAPKTKVLHQYVWMPYGGLYISYQQKFDAWTSVFYHGEAPENYSALPK